MQPAQVLEIENVDARREAIGRCGVERVFDHVPGHDLDASGVYALREIDLGTRGKRRYLKMLNPSISAWHVEPVHPTCSTVEQAINWRNGSDVTPEVLT